MARTHTNAPTDGKTLRWIAASAVIIYTGFTVSVAPGGSDASYLVPLWATWAAVVVVAVMVFGIGVSLGKASNAHHVAVDDQRPVLTSVG